MPTERTRDSSRSCVRNPKRHLLGAGASSKFVRQPKRKEGVVNGATQASRRAGCGADGRLQRHRTGDGSPLRRERRQGGGLGQGRGGTKFPSPRDTGQGRRSDGRGRRGNRLRAGQGGGRPCRRAVREARHLGAPRRGGALRHLRADDPRGVRARHRCEPHGQVYGAMATLPHLKREGRGALIHISSVEAKRSFPFHSVYGASKHGIGGFLEALRVELKHEGWPISVTQVMPGTINTPFFDKGRTKLGVKPVGIPPIYEPETVAKIILYAAENPARDLVSGGGAQALIINQRLSPRMLDAILATRAGFSPQKTEEPRSEDDPDNLYAPIRGHDTVRNGFRALSRSLYNWLEMHPRVRRGAVGGEGAGLLGTLRRGT